MAKPDNRADNVAHLQKSINHTLENLHEGEQYLDEHANEISAEERSQLKEKNERRKKAIDGFVEESKDEAADRQK